ncbi:MAG: hypothetical protein ABSH20_07100, partial [Tepidisphaeraceae bacterium]
DYATIDYYIPAFSRRATAGLADLIEHNGELLPITTEPDIGPYWAFNVITIADVLDQERSTVTLFEGSSFAALDIPHFVFRAGMLASLAIFRIPQSTLFTLVTGRFAARVRDLGLRGFRFDRIWPLPSGTNWRLLAKAQSQKEQGAERPAEREVRSAHPPVKIVGRPPNTEEQQGLQDGIEEYKQKLNIDPSKASVSEIQHVVELMVLRLQASGCRDNEYLLDQAFLLGLAWGETLVRDLGWKWEMLVAENGATALAVVSPDRGLAVTPLLFMKRLVTVVGTDCTSELTFNMIKAGRFFGEPGSLHLVG